MGERRVFDGFLFYNELDILEIRLREMGPAVHRFVLVEAEETFQGHPKPLIYAENKARFAAWADKIIHVVVPAGPVPPTRYGEVWSRERYQRDQIARGLSEARPGDLILVSDVDEIVRGDVLARAAADYRSGRPVIFSTGMHRFFLDRREPGVVWQGARMIEKRHFHSPQRLRNLKSLASKRWRRLGLAAFGLRWRNLLQSRVFMPALEIRDSGWHFSSIGGFEAYRRKVDAFSHTEYKDTDEYRSPAAFEAWIQAHAAAPLDSLPACVTREGLFSNLLAPEAGEPESGGRRARNVSDA